MPNDNDKPNPDQLVGVAHPRESSRLFGHFEINELFLEALRRNKLHHAILLHGKQGVGKATLAYLFAKQLLSRQGGASVATTPAFELDQNSKDVQLIVRDNHPNLLILRRVWNVKTKRFATQISVDRVRELQRFLGNTAGMGKWRVVIVDRADDLNINAANALLKMLEEPPAYCLFVLVSCEPGKLPNTIRSRCQMLHLKALDDTMMNSGLEHIARQSGLALPEAEQRPLILKLAQGSIGQALQCATGRTLTDYREIAQILDLLPRVDPLNTIALSERLSARTNEPDYHSFVHLLSSQISNRIRAMVLSGHGEKQALAQWTKLWETITNKKIETDLLNLDRGSFILDLFAQIEEIASKNGGLKL